MEEAYVILSNGRRFENTTVLESAGNLYLYIRDEDETLKTVFDGLFQSDGTDEITARRYGEDKEYTGYTVLCSVSKEMNGLITAGLTKGV